MRKLLLFLCLLASLTEQALGENTPVAPVVSQPDPHQKIWNLDNIDIKTVISEVAQATGKNFVIDPRVQGKVSLISGVPIKTDELYAIFLKVLQSQGYEAIKTGTVFRIVPENTVKSLEIPVITHQDTRNNANNTKNSYITQIIPVLYTQANQLIPILRPLLPSASDISAYAATNAIIVSAEADKVTEIQKIIHHLDQPSAANIEVVSLHYASATELSNSLRSVLSGTGGTGSRTEFGIAADKGSNSILLSGPESQRQRIKQLIIKMDDLAANSAISNTTVVVHLHYLNAKDFAPVLQKMVANGNTLAVDSGIANTDITSTPAKLGVGAGWINNLPGMHTSNGADGDTTSRVQIQPEIESNAIVMSGPPGQIRALRAVIAKLDTKPQQVLVEALMVEVSESTIKQLGIEWGTLPPSGQLPDTPAGFSGVTGGLGLGIVESGRMKAILHALQNDSTTNILSTPSIVVLNNQKAEIKVGKKVSDTTGSYIPPTGSSPGGASGPFQTYSPKDVALHLNVTPQISQDNMIRMEIDQGNQTLLATKSGGGNQDTAESSIKTAVIIRTGQILVIGGLISNDYEDNIQKVPLLGSIPILGKLFQYKNDNLAKKNLLVFLSPMIMDDSKQAHEKTNSQYNMIRQLQLDRRKNQDILTPSDANAAILPRYPAVTLPAPF